MCLILLAWHAHPDYPLVVAANRDEYFARPTTELGFWLDHPAVLAGRDLQAGGTWLGVTRNGRIAALTNYRQAENRNAVTPSRGLLVSDFLTDSCSAADYLASLHSRASDYRGFNLLCGTLDTGLWHYANRAPSGQPGHVQQSLTPGIYGLSNNLLDVPWPKVAQGKSELTHALAALPDDAALFSLLRNDARHDDAVLPRTGVSLDWERTLSAAFVRAPDYGTRSSTVMMFDKHGILTIDEQIWLPNARPGNRHRYRLRLDTAGNRSDSLD